MIAAGSPGKSGALSVMMRSARSHGTGRRSSGGVGFVGFVGFVVCASVPGNPFPKTLNRRLLKISDGYDAYDG